MVTGAAGRVGSAGKDDEFVGVPALVGLGPGELKDETTLVVGDVVDVDAGDLGAAQCGDEPNKEYRAVAGTGKIRLRGPAAGFPAALGGEGG